MRDIERGNLNLGFVRPAQNMGAGKSDLALKAIKTIDGSPSVKWLGGFLSYCLGGT